MNNYFIIKNLSTGKYWQKKGASCFWGPFDTAKRFRSAWSAEAVASVDPDETQIQKVEAY